MILIYMIYFITSKSNPVIRNKEKEKEIKRIKKWTFLPSKKRKSEKYGDTLYVFIWNSKVSLMI